tara:strand:- start:146 stop:1168 length:1023 start_codon:yes stop_codon:yes gene_type:complete
MKVLVTGAAGFIGFHLSKRLLKDGYNLIAIDNLNNYYDPNLKKDRLNELKIISRTGKNRLNFFQVNLEDYASISNIFKKFKPNIVVNLAAQAGVRYSLKNPKAYIDSNLVGFGNIIEECKNYGVEHLIYASSSSVYGGNKNIPFSEEHGVNHPVSLYAATKRSNELMAHTYSHIYNLPTTGLRFFTVYGPWGRPDMAYFLFTDAIINNKPIKIFNNGKMCRDFTYIDDVINGIIGVMKNVSKKDIDFNFLDPKISSSWAPYRLFNIGNSSPIKLMDFITIIEKCLGKKAMKEFLPMQMGDVESTSANINSLKNLAGFEPKTSIDEGISKFIEWYLDYYKI